MKQFFSEHLGELHPTAIVYPGAKIGAGSRIGPYCVIGPKVVIGERNILASHVVIDGVTEIGSDNQIFPFASLGTRPQDLKFRGEESRLVIGNQNLIREYVTIQPGTLGAKMLTIVGNQNLFMVNSHLGHDSQVGDRNIIANGVAIAGHVTISNGVILGGLSAVHQHVRLGDFAFAGGGAMIVNDVPPFCMVNGDRARLVGINVVGLSRNGFSTDEIREIKEVYRKLFIADGVFKERLAELERQFAEHPRLKEFFAFIKSSERGIVGATRNLPNLTEL
ncbi:MAG TPA: acyl-ACP--UDP-N-acetylglucosamine O-acyltransferase [Oligoflexia bacterium]|nr:acyl-ACP--UDP-N-acetylglucosamine O-acyltransferase [Oligoflexia bacterium]HMP27117.1 acyl-ACP--UDP-N-acetylglucosamine O-acyltransferase [Oligoflexia bacterium]